MRKGGGVVSGKTHASRLHISRRVVELLGDTFAEERDTIGLEMQVMKKLMILTAVAMLTASAVGCDCWRRFRRGDEYVNPCPPTATYSVPCPSPCDPCDPCSIPPTVTPGPAPFTPSDS